MDEKCHCNEYVHFEHSGVRVGVYLSTYEVVVNLLRMLIRDIIPVELCCIRCGANNIY